MAIKVTAAQAGWLVERAERVVRWHIERGDLPAEKRGRAHAIDVDDLARVVGWKVNRTRLAEMEMKDARTAESMAGQLATLQRDVESLKARIRSLEIDASSASDAPQRPAQSASVSAPIPTPALPYGVYNAVGALDASRVLLGPFADRHGVPATTAKSQALSQHAYPITSAPRPNRPSQREHYLATDDQRRAALAYWRAGAPGYHECDAPDCLCHEAF